MSARRTLTSRSRHALASGGVDGAFERLDPALPLLLLPVRIETRFALSRQRKELLVRIFPDHIQGDAHKPSLSSSEIARGRAFWRAAWSITRESMDASFARLATRLGAFRAAWVLEATRPLNWFDRGHPPARPQFPEIAPTSTIAPVRARLLPDRWILSCYQRQDHRATVVGKSIPRDLAIAPDFAAQRAPKNIAELMDDQGMHWLRTFGAAVDVGMGLRVSLDPPFAFDEPTELFVIGIRSGESPEDAAAGLASLLAAHNWTHGIDFVRRGTPTNNTDLVDSGVSIAQPDTAALLDVVLTAPDPRESQEIPLTRRHFRYAAQSALGIGPGSVLDRVTQRNDDQLALGASMNGALWPATWGYFLRTMLAGCVPADAIDWTRSHFIEYVRGGGTLPTLRLGRQPYGLLPVTTERSDPQGTTRDQILANTLLELLPTWSHAVETRVAHLDPDATDLSGTRVPTSKTLGTATAALARILGATPNPSDLVLTPVTDETALYVSAWGTTVVLLTIVLVPFPDIGEALIADLLAAPTLEEEIAVLQQAASDGSAADGFPYPAGPLWYEAHSSTSDPETSAAAQNAIDFIKTVPLPLLYNQQTRVGPILGLGPDRENATARLGVDDESPLFTSFFGDDTERIAWKAPLVAGASGDATEVSGWLDALVAQAQGGPPATPPADPAPLLFQLLQRSLAVVHDHDRADMLDGLSMLADAVRAGRLADPATDLETLMGETLGTSTHRLDAWLTSLAAKRLATMRNRRPRGIQVGGFGWVDSLRQRSGEASQGFIHAPSLDLAATAAIMRSGWSALGDGALGVNISSARVRRAQWLVDGIRDGRGLPELLGQSLERRLHDAHLDGYVEPLRRAVLDATGHPGRPARAIVDGLLVARAWTGGDEISPLTSEESAVRDALAKLSNAFGDGRMRTVLTAHGTDVDAIADTTLVQSVHALLRGNSDAASSALAASTGERAPAELTALRTQRGGQQITHRVVLLLDVAAPVEPSPESTPDEIVEPALEQWLRSALPLEGVAYNASGKEAGAAVEFGTFDLADMRIGMVDLMTALSPGTDVAASRLARRLAWRHAREAAEEGRLITVAIDPDPLAAAGGMTLRLFAAAAQSLNGLLQASRPLDATDLASGSVPPGADVTVVAQRELWLNDAARGAVTRLRTVIDNDATTGDILDALEALIAWRIPGSIPAAGLVDLVRAGDATDRGALVEQATHALSHLQARIDARDAITGADLAAALQRIRTLLPGALVLPPFSPANLDELQESAGRCDARVGDPALVLPWLHQAGGVRERVGAAAAAIDLVESVTDATRFEPLLVQIPDYADEGWIAMSAPTHDKGPRLCLLSITTPAALATSQAGLLLDAWTETIPDQETTTGIAVHFDAPSAQAPQALLLALAPAGEKWTFGGALQIVRQTFDRARHRAVGPDEIEGFGQYLPAIYLDDATDPGTASASSFVQKASS